MDHDHHKDYSINHHTYKVNFNVCQQKNAMFASRTLNTLKKTLELSGNYPDFLTFLYYFKNIIFSIYN